MAPMGMNSPPTAFMSWVRHKSGQSASGRTTASMLRESKGESKYAVLEPIKRLRPTCAFSSQIEANKVQAADEIPVCRQVLPSLWP